MRMLLNSKATISYRYVRYEGNQVVHATAATADAIGRYETDDSGLPQWLEDLPLSAEQVLRSKGVTIE